MLEKYIPLYLFVFFSALFLTVITEKQLIPRLSARARQPLYEIGPSWHSVKDGTPTMGGLAFLLAAAISLTAAILFLSYAGESEVSVSLLLTSLFCVANAAIGIIDDLTKIKRKQNAGLTASQKLFLQLLAAILFLTARRILLNDTTEIYFSFGVFDLGAFYYPLAIAALLGTVNCANLTDGIDGLASSVAFTVGAVILLMSAHKFFDTAILSAVIMGCAIGFLFFNLNPAKIFMGDTGSLFFGAAAAGCSFGLRNPLILLLVGGVYLLEGISVILQVLYYKLTGKRIFKMAPLHHHLEKSGMGENKICLIAIILTILLSIPAFLIFAR